MLRPDVKQPDAKAYIQPSCGLNEAVDIVFNIKVSPTSVVGLLIGVDGHYLNLVHSDQCDRACVWSEGWCCPPVFCSAFPCFATKTSPKTITDE